MLMPKTRLLSITDNREIHADFMVYENDVHLIENGQKVDFTVSNRPGEELSATIFAIGKEFEPNTRAVHIHARLDKNPGNLIPGMYVSGHIHTDENNHPAPFLTMRWLPKELNPISLFWMNRLKQKNTRGHEHEAVAENEERHDHEAEENHEEHEGEAGHRGRKWWSCNGFPHGRSNNRKARRWLHRNKVAQSLN